MTSCGSNFYKHLSFTVFLSLVNIIKASAIMTIKPEDEDRGDAWETTIRIKNIHCASCTSTIERLLSELGTAIYRVKTYIEEHKVHVAHEKSLSASRICYILSQAAFEVYSAITSDETGREVRKLGGDDDGDAWLEAAATLWRPPVKASTSTAVCLQLSDSDRRNTHLANCDACRKESAASSTEAIVEKSGLHEQEDLSLTDQAADDGSASSLNHQSPKSGTSRYEALLSIGGMTCASCTSAITKGVSELPYVHSVNVTLMTNSALVLFSGKENLDSIVELVEDLGYDSAVERCAELDEVAKRSESTTQPRSVMLGTEGMFCKHCPARIIEAIIAAYPDQVTIEQSPEIKEPVLKLNYLAHPPNFTIRDIVATIDSVNDAFHTTIYNPPTIEERSQAIQRHERDRLLIRLVFSAIIAIPTLLLGVIWMSLVSESNGIRKYFEQQTWSGVVTRSDWALFILATPVFFLAADVFHVRAIKEIRALWRKGSRVPLLQRFYRFGSMNLLVSAGTAIAYFASIAVLAIDATTEPSGNSKSSSTYFDSVVFLTFFILCGRWLEAYSKAKTGNAVGLLGNLRPREATLVTYSRKTLEDVSNDSSESERDPPSQRSTTRIDAKLLEIGDVVIVSHGSSPPADGIIVNGSTKFNESSLTGESRAVSKIKGDKVFSGAVNVGGPITVETTDVGGTSMLDQIVAVVREGQTRRAPVERVVDIVTGYFVPVITALAIMTFLIWLALGESGALDAKYLNSERGGWPFWSLEFAIAVFVVACPCGIGLAAPTALFVGGGLAASHGILVRGGGEAFQEASNIDAVVFDKTGTLSEGGDLKVTDYEMIAKDSEAQTAWSIISSLEESSSHPLARAILEIASTMSSQQITTVSITEEPGLGLCGTFTTSSPPGEETTYEAALGNESLIASLAPPPAPVNYFTTTTLSTWKSQSKSIALLALRKFPTPSSPPTPWTVTTLFAITDPLRLSAHPTLSRLRTQGIPTYILTGDNPTTAAAVAATLGVPADHVFAGVLPTEKASKIRWLQEHGPRRRSSPSWSRSSEKRTRATVAFVGDGINDAPALTAADVSISLSSASDIAMHSSSFILLSSELGNVITLFELSKRVFRRVKLNFGWAVVYNIILVPVAAGVFFKVDSVGWRLGPVWGSAAMALSSLCVVGSSLALRWEGGWGVGWLKGRSVSKG